MCDSQSSLMQVKNIGNIPIESE